MAIIGVKVNKEKRTIQGWGSRQSIDRDNMLILADGWQIENFLKNPVLLWAHDYQSQPLGKVTKVEKRIGEGLYFYGEIGDSERANEVLGMLDFFGSIAVSVGIQPLKVSQASVRELKELGVDCGERTDGEMIRVVERAELLDVSLVSVGAHPDAMAHSRSAGELPVTQKICFTKELDDNEIISEAIKQALSGIDIQRLIKIQYLVKLGRVLEEEPTDAELDEMILAHKRRIKNQPPTINLFLGG